MWANSSVKCYSHHSEQEEGGGGHDMTELIPEISTVKIAMRVAHIKRDSLAGPDGILRKHVRAFILSVLQANKVCLDTSPNGSFACPGHHAAASCYSCPVLACPTRRVHGGIP
jgi:hypothetical protein